jgi:hypothetical protein
MSMRTLLIVCLLATAAQAEERTWSISYTTSAELVEVRGDTAYLKSGDRIEQVPIARLSAGDRQYISLMPLAPLFPGSIAVNDSEALPLPVKTAEAASRASYEAPVQPPTSGRTAMMAPQNDAGEMNTVEHSMLASPINAPQLNAPMNVPADESFNAPAYLPPPQTGDTTSTTVRRFVQQPQPQPQQQQPQTLLQRQKQNRAAADRSRADSRPGLFGGRARRLANERQ